jgi:hypothetical protein
MLRKRASQFQKQKQIIVLIRIGGIVLIMMIIAIFYGQFA